MTLLKKLLDYCSEPHSPAEIRNYMELKNRTKFRRSFIAPLLVAGVLKMTIPNKPNSRLQEYYVNKEWLTIEVTTIKDNGTKDGTKDGSKEGR